MRTALHRPLLWLWKTAPFPLWSRRLFLSLIARRFLIGALAIIQDADGRVLMVKQTYRRHRPWGLPGGWIKSAETIQEGLAREVYEETGLKVAVGRVVGLRPGPYEEVVIIFECRIVGGHLHPSSPEVSEAAYFAPHDLPPTESLYYEVVHDAIHLRQHAG